MTRKKREQKDEAPAVSQVPPSVPGTCPFLTGKRRVVAKLRRAANKRDVIFVVVKVCDARATYVTLNVTGIEQTFAVTGAVRNEKLLLNRLGRAYWLERP